MILTAHQPVYLPWLGLFHKIAVADAFVTFNQVQYLAKDWNNRNLIKTPQGPLWLTVPVLRKGYLEKTISQIEINNSEPWQRKHWRSMLGNYRKAPFFSKYSDFFEDVYKRDWRLLVELNDYMLKWFIETLQIEVQFLDASQYQFCGMKSGLVLDMCVQLGASTFIFGALGKDYADVEAFSHAGVTAVFQDYRHPQYPQQGDPFEPNLSVVDLLFNCGENSHDILMSGNVSKAEIGKCRPGACAAPAPDPAVQSRAGLLPADTLSSGLRGMDSVLIRADASEEIGTGHVMRMLALAQSLKDQGVHVTLATAALPAALMSRWCDERIPVVRLNASYPDPRDAEGLTAAVTDCGADWVILDGYQFDSSYHRKVRQAGVALLVVDDYAHLPDYDADIVLNQNIGANEFVYCLPWYTHKLCGLPYVMLRREFLKARLSLSPQRQDARRVLVTLGGSDENNMTAMVLDALALVKDRRLVVDVVVGGACAHEASLRRQLETFPHEAHLYVNCDDMPLVMRLADVAISGAGSTSWELVAMGVPMCVVTLAENQQLIAEWLGDLGAAVSLGLSHDLRRERLAEVVKALLVDFPRRQQMRQACLPLVDGLGCERIINRLRLWAKDKTANVWLRPAQMADAQLLWKWANDPVVREGAFVTTPIPWETHQRWFMGKLMSDDAQIWVALDEAGHALGEIRFDRKGDEVEVDISVVSSLRNRGIGRAILRLGEVLVIRRWPVRRIRARIKETNTASLGCFQSAGYEETEPCVIGAVTSRQFSKQW